MYTITDFSVRTGLPVSTLRFYERKSLLIPAGRRDNGYRVYTQEQIDAALTIHSLRLAGIGISDIKRYLEANSETRTALLGKWRKDVEQKLALMQVSRQYLYGIQGETEGVRLLKWEQPVPFLWFRYEEKQTADRFKKMISKLYEQLCASGISIHEEAYVRQFEMRGAIAQGEIGYRPVSSPPDIRSLILSNVTAACMEIMEPSLFAVMDIYADNDFLCFDYMMLLKKYGFEPVGHRLEKYDPSESNARLVQLMIPVH